MLIHLCVKAAKVMGSKVAVSRPFIIDKETAETYRRLFCYSHTFFKFYIVVVSRQNSAPVNKWRNAHKFRKMEKTVNCTALVASDYDDFVRTDTKYVTFTLTGDF